MWVRGRGSCLECMRLWFWFLVLWNQLTQSVQSIQEIRDGHSVYYSCFHAVSIYIQIFPQQEFKQNLTRYTWTGDWTVVATWDWALLAASGPPAGKRNSHSSVKMNRLWDADEEANLIPYHYNKVQYKTSIRPNSASKNVPQTTVPSADCPPPWAAYTRDTPYTMCPFSQTQDEVLLQKESMQSGKSSSFSFGHNEVPFLYHLITWKQCLSHSEQLWRIDFWPWTKMRASFIQQSEWNTMIWNGTGSHEDSLGGPQ